MESLSGFAHALGGVRERRSEFPVYTCGRATDGAVDRSG
jgi:hypothetical protein